MTEPPSRPEARSLFGLAGGQDEVACCGPPGAATPSSLAFPDILPLPLLSRHWLSADLLALYLHVIGEQPEVLAQRYQRGLLVVHLHAQRSVHRLPDFGNRGGRR